jgi:acetyl-CoA synthetase
MADTKSTPSFDSVLHEERVFPPSKEFARKAHIPSLAQYRKMYKQSVERGVGLG